MVEEAAIEKQVIWMKKKKLAVAGELETAPDKDPKPEIPGQRIREKASGTSD